MGLSDEERQHQLWYACNAIHKAADKVDKELGAVCRTVWPAFLGGTSNGVHWILGSGADNPIEKPDSAWGAALMGQFETDRHEEHEPEHRKLARKEFNPFKGFLDIIGLLRAGDPEKAAVFELFARTEVAVYALRRYNDEFLSNRKDLSDLIAIIQGMCFDRFHKSAVYPRAYLLNMILERLYGGRYSNQEDKVRDAIMKVNGHHDLKRPMEDRESLLVLRGWDLQGRRAKTPKARIKLFLRIAGRRFRYEHQFNQLLAEAGIEKPKQVAKLRKFWGKHCVTPHKERDAESMGHYRKEHEVQARYAIHGLVDE